MGRYASQTMVSPERSRTEIERTLARYGADQFVYGYSDGAAMIGFRLDGRSVKLGIKMPTADDAGVSETPKGRPRKAKVIVKALNQEERRRWRAFALVIKAKLEAIGLGISTLDEEFLSGIVMPNGLTVGQWLVPRLDNALGEGKMPPLLPMLEAP